MNRTLEDLVESYIKVQEFPHANINHDSWWAIDYFFDISEFDPDFAWAAILEIINRNPSKRVISMLAAGPLEDLIDKNGDKVIDRIEKEAKKNEILRNMLKIIYESGEKEIWNRIQAASKA